MRTLVKNLVSDACQINDFDHYDEHVELWNKVSDACQINDFDHNGQIASGSLYSFRCLSDQ